MKLGVAYYPEVFDSSEWERDLRLMRQSGIDWVRVFEFAWTTVELREGEYTWTWLDTFLDLCDEVGLRVILCTPTAVPPAWLNQKHPDIMGELPDGTRRPFGSRRQVCNTSQIYRQYSVGIARRLSERYGSRDVVVGWQIDNELFGPEDASTSCHCPECNAAFRLWLKNRYEKIEEVNDTWGLNYWNQAYGHWEEVGTPRHKHSSLGWVIDYTEFFSDMTAEFMKLQYDAIKEFARPDQWVVTNSTGVMNVGMDHRNYSRLMDAGAWDSYPGAAGRPLEATYSALAHEMFRSATFKPFHVLESPSWEISPSFFGECFARGAASVSMWHWRCIPYGPENHADTICHYDGKPRPGRLETIRSIREKIDRIPPAPDVVSKQEVAFIYDQANVRVTRKLENWRSCNYLTTLPKVYHALWQHGMPADVVAPRESLDGYRLVVIPSLQLMDHATAELFAGFVREGGILVACAPFAQRDCHAKWYTDTGAISEKLLGVEQADTISRGETGATIDGEGEFEIEHSSQWIRPTSAEVLGRFTDGGYAGEAAVTQNEIGEGRVYFAACMSQSLMAWLIKKAATEAGIRVWENNCADLTIIPHLDGKGTWLCNHSDSKQVVEGVSVNAKGFEFIQTDLD